MSNIWHDISESRIAPDEFIAVVEISKGSKKKYELDKETAVDEVRPRADALEIIKAAIVDYKSVFS